MDGRRPLADRHHRSIWLNCKDMVGVLRALAGGRGPAASLVW